MNDHEDAEELDDLSDAVEKALYDE